MNSHFHFLGICGTAMGAVAAAMARRGFTVTGSDANGIVRRRDRALADSCIAAPSFSK